MQGIVIVSLKLQFIDPYIDTVPPLHPVLQVLQVDGVEQVEQEGVVVVHDGVVVVHEGVVVVVHDGVVTGVLQLVEDIEDAEGEEDIMLASIEAAEDRPVLDYSTSDSVLV